MRTAAPRYRLFTFGSRSVIAVPAYPAAHLRAGLRCLQTETPRRALFRTLVTIAAAGRCDRLIAKTTALPLPVGTLEAIEAWLGQLLKPRVAVRLVIQWPPQTWRQRIYLHVLDEDGRRTCFVKVSLDDDNDDMLSREASTIASLSQSRPIHFDVPQVLDCQRVTNHLALALRPLPSLGGRRRAITSDFPADAVREYSTFYGDFGAAELATVDWFAAAMSGIRDDGGLPFKAEILADSKPWTLVRAHGDLGVHNLLPGRGRPWIFDWEESMPNAPVFTDQVGFSLSALSRQLLRRPHQWRRIVDRSAPLLTHLPRRELMIALAFRSVRISSAMTIINHWDQSDGWGQT